MCLLTELIQPLRQRKLDNLFKDEEETRSGRNVVLQKDAKDTMDNNGVSAMMETKRKLILNIRKRQLKFLEHIMRKEGLGKPDTHRTGRGKERQRKAAHDILGELE